MKLDVSLSTEEFAAGQPCRTSARGGSKCVYVLIKIVYIIYSKLWIFVAQNCEVLTVRIVNIV